MSGVAVEVGSWFKLQLSLRGYGVSKSWDLFIFSSIFKLLVDR